MIKKYLLLFLIFLFSSIEAFSQEKQGILRNESSETSSVKEGDTFIATLTIWPIAFVEEGQFKKNLVDKPFLNFFHVTEVMSEGFSENNQEAYEIKLRLILTKFFDNRNFVIWDYKGLNIPVTIKGITPVPLKGRNQNFILLSQDYLEKKEINWLPYILVLILFLGIAGFYLPKYLKKKKEKKYLDEKIQKWKASFKNAQSRDQLEGVYASREDWIILLPMKTPEILDFFETINKHQYKKEWTDEDEREVVNSFDSIREVFS